MIEKILTALKFAFRQKQAFYGGTEMLKKLFTFKIPFKRIFAAIAAIFELFWAAFFDTPIHPYKDQLDLTGYELVFEDEFDGKKIDTDVWESRYEGGIRCGYVSMDQVSVRDGNLVITGEYKEDGKYGAGWYSGDIRLKKEYCRGYFEIRCKVAPNTSSTRDLWSSFWLTNMNAYDAKISKGGLGAVELDIMECFSANNKKGKLPKAVTHSIWCNGVDADPKTTDGRNFGKYYAEDPCEEYNTYGFLWTEDEYVWYVNGVETVRSSYANGVCKVPEIVVISLSMPNNEPQRGHAESVEYTIDYMRIYQQKK